jgi:hypothetical protein
MRSNRHTVQSFLDVRIHVLNGSLEKCFSAVAPGFSANRGTAFRSRSQRDRPTTFHALVRPHDTAIYPPNLFLRSDIFDLLPGS